MSTGMIDEPQYKRHDTGPHHPESARRLDAIHDKLHASGLIDQLDPIDAFPCPDKAILRVHSPAYIERLRTACRAGQPFVDVHDSAICPVSYDIARLAAGGVLAAVDAVAAGRLRNAFCPVRPPGHHAERDASMGFCLLNNIAIAADHLIHERGYGRVAIVDFDVHHGNGTQHAFEDRSDVLFVSVHEDPLHLYPGTGYAHETGRGAGEGYTLNVEMRPGSGDEAYRQAYDQQILPRLEAFEPEFLLISAGFDAAEADPLAHLSLSAGAFAWMTRDLKHIAERHAQGRLVSVLEGGYNLQSLGRCTEIHLNVLLEPEGV